MCGMLWSGPDVEDQNAAVTASLVTHSLVTLIMWHARCSPSWVKPGSWRTAHDMWQQHNHATVCTGYQAVVTMQIELGGRGEWKRPGKWFLWSHCGSQFHLDCHNKTTLFIKHCSGSVPKRGLMWASHTYKPNSINGDVGNIQRKPFFFSLMFSVSESLIISSSRQVLLHSFLYVIIAKF